MEPVTFSRAEMLAAYGLLTADSKLSSAADELRDLRGSLRAVRELDGVTARDWERKLEPGAVTKLKRKLLLLAQEVSALEEMIR